MEFECSLLYSDKFSIGVYPAPHKSCEHLHTCFFKICFIVLCHQKWSELKSGFLNTEYFNTIYVHIYYSPMEDASSMYSNLLFLSSCLTKSNMKFSQARYCCLTLRSKNSTWHSLFKHPHTLSVHLTVGLSILHSYKTVGKYIPIISVHSGKISVNFIQMQLHTKNSIVKENFKDKICDFSF
jgi:hypothetical protein